MAYYGSKLALLDDNVGVYDVGNTHDIAEYESSGYDSCSDVSADRLSIGSNDTPPSRSKRREEMMMFSNDKSLLDSLECMLSMPEMCDVIFLVGVNRIPVYGVKAILSTRSRVLFQLILKSQREASAKSKSKTSGPTAFYTEGRLAIPVSSYDPAIFKLFIQFIHCGRVQIEIQSVVGLLAASSEFRVKDLKKACQDFIDMISFKGRLSELEMTCADYSRHSIVRRVSDMIIHQSRRRETTV